VLDGLFFNCVIKKALLVHSRLLARQDVDMLIIPKNAIYFSHDHGGLVWRRELYQICRCLL